jgi:hypothetical protein
VTQTRLQSFRESWANTALGLVVSIAASFVIFPLLGMQSNAFQNIGAVLAFTVISVVRNYVVRRFFNHVDG